MLRATLGLPVIFIGKFQVLTVTG